MQITVITRCPQTLRSYVCLLTWSYLSDYRDSLLLRRLLINQLFFEFCRPVVSLIHKGELQVAVGTIPSEFLQGQS